MKIHSFLFIMQIWLLIYELKFSLSSIFDNFLFNFSPIFKNFLMKIIKWEIIWLSLVKFSFASFNCFMSLSYSYPDDIIFMLCSLFSSEFILLWWDFLIVCISNVILPLHKNNSKSYADQLEGKITTLLPKMLLLAVMNHHLIKSNLQ